MSISPELLRREAPFFGQVFPRPAAATNKQPRSSTPRLSPHSRTSPPQRCRSQSPPRPAQSHPTPCGAMGYPRCETVHRAMPARYGVSPAATFLPPPPPALDLPQPLALRTTHPLTAQNWETHSRTTERVTEATHRESSLPIPVSLGSRLIKNFSNSHIQTQVRAAPMG